MDTQPKHDELTQSKTAYQTPQIIDYGDIETLTQSGGLTGGDPQAGFSGPMN